MSAEKPLREYTPEEAEELERRARRARRWTLAVAALMYLTLVGMCAAVALILLLRAR
jgi:cell division septal protein FtsQ